MIKKQMVRDLMTPIENFHRISKDASLIDAILVLESAQKDMAAGKANQRIVVVENEKGEVVGKISPSNVIRGLEPGYENIVSLSRESRAHAVDYVINTMKYHALLWSKPTEDICATVKDVKVKDFYNQPTEGQTIQIDDTLDKALHCIVLGRHRSLFVMDRGKVVGLLQFSKVYSEICEQVKQCTF
jgi:CBS domain-containing protein